MTVENITATENKTTHNTDDAVDSTETHIWDKHVLRCWQIHYTIVLTAEYA
jgi:hypothetical protein